MGGRPGRGVIYRRAPVLRCFYGFLESPNRARLCMQTNWLGADGCGWGQAPTVERLAGWVTGLNFNNILQALKGK